MKGQFSHGSTILFKFWQTSLIDCRHDCWSVSLRDLMNRTSPCAKCSAALPHSQTMNYRRFWRPAQQQNVAFVSHKQRLTSDVLRGTRHGTADQPSRQQQLRGLSCAHLPNRSPGFVCVVCAVCPAARRVGPAGVVVITMSSIRGLGSCSTWEEGRRTLARGQNPGYPRAVQASLQPCGCDRCGHETLTSLHASAPDCPY